MLRAILPAPTSQEIEEAELAIAELCAEQGGAHIYRTVDNVEGFVDTGTTFFRNGLDAPPTGTPAGRGCFAQCLRYLLDGFRYVEAKLSLQKGSYQKERDFVGAPAGLYRYELVDRDGDNCDRFDRMAKFMGSIEAAVRKHPEQLANKCAVGHPISEFQSRFRYDSYSAILNRYPNHMYISASGNRVTDVQSGEVLAINTLIIARIPRYGRRVLATCGQENISFYLTDVLMPPK